ncbi:hypothetical protein [Lichenihabitans psoromatis]|uniref:hypothetical protein n=1 Tax=Lichenihabitans psoromatis TaxID=2528642 RepID=UPI00103842F7|nr:hypothetical protein [Lichenihabitans psoromatis]
MDISTVEFSVYDKVTGQVTVSGTTQKVNASFHVQPGQALVYKWLKGTEDYMDVTSQPMRPKLRPALPGFDKLTIKADGTDAATIVLPDAMTVTIDGLPAQHEAGPLAFKADSPGAYVVSITQFPYLDFSAVITAT